MNRKYIKPLIKIHRVKPSSIICASEGGPNAGGHYARKYYDSMDDNEENW